MKEHTNWDYQAIEETLNDPLLGEYRTYDTGQTSGGAWLGVDRTDPRCNVRSGSCTKACPSVQAVSAFSSSYTGCAGRYAPLNQTLFCERKCSHFRALLTADGLGQSVAFPGENDDMGMVDQAIHQGGG